MSGNFSKGLFLFAKKLWLFHVVRERRAAAWEKLQWLSARTCFLLERRDFNGNWMWVERGEIPDNNSKVIFVVLTIGHVMSYYLEKENFCCLALIFLKIIFGVHQIAIFITRFLFSTNCVAEGKKDQILRWSPPLNALLCSPSVHSSQPCFLGAPILEAPDTCFLFCSLEPRWSVFQDPFTRLF